MQVFAEEEIEISKLEICLCVGHDICRFSHRYKITQ